MVKIKKNASKYAVCFKKLTWLDLNFLFCTWLALRIPTAYCLLEYSEAPSLQGFSSPSLQYHFCFQTYKPVQIVQLSKESQ